MNVATAEADGTAHARALALRHLAGIQGLACEVERPLEEVAAVYQCELVHLSAHAAVVDFLPVLVAKRVRRLYRRRLEALDEDDPCARLIPAR